MSASLIFALPLPLEVEGSGVPGFRRPQAHQPPAFELQRDPVGVLLEAGAWRTQVDRVRLGIVLAELCELAAKAIKKGDKFAIPGFVTVKVRARKARIGRNPQTGDAIKIPAKKVVKALPAKALKDIIATKKK